MPEHICPWWYAYSFDHPLRRLFQKQKRIVGPYIEPGMTVLDLGCGMGYFSIAMADMVGPGGRVISLDLQQKMLDILMVRAEKKGLAERIRPVLAASDDLRLDDKVDFALAMWMVHEVSDKGRFFGQVAKRLKPGAKLLVAEPRFHVSKENLEKSIRKAEENGLRLAARPRVGLSIAALLQKQGVRP